MIKKTLKILYTVTFIVFSSHFPAFSEDLKPNLMLAEHTSPEIAKRIAAGYDRILIPTAGVEQNGSYGALNKHQRILEYTAPLIAEKLGHTLIAPIVNFVPEGDPTKKEGHTAFPGTLSVPDAVFQSLLTQIVQSLAPHGFKKFYFIGDHGGSQIPQEQAAREMRERGLHVFAINEYYNPEKQTVFLMEKYGFTRAEIGTHMGIIDTSELMNAAPDAVRKDQISGKPEAGVTGDPRKATAKLGKELSAIKIHNALKEIEKIEANGLYSAKKTASPGMIESLSARIRSFFIQ